MVGRVGLRRGASLCVPLLEISNCFRHGCGRSVPLLAGRTGNLYGVEKAALAIPDDLPMRPLNPGGDELRFDIVDGEGVTELASVVVRRATARYVRGGHKGSVAGGA